MAMGGSASRVLFGLACLLWGGALAMLIAVYTLPSEGFQDLGRFVGAMLLAAIAIIPFALSLALGRGTAMPRWMSVVAWVGIVLGALPAVVILTARVAG